jgi:hypothetical protein
MAIVTFKSGIHGLSGRIGNVIFRRCGDQTVMCRLPRTASKKRTPAQIAHQERFRVASAYGCEATADPALRARYQAHATRANRSVRQIAMRDYMHPPIVAHIDLASFLARPGDVIWIDARDDTAVSSVDVTLRKGGNAILEQGAAEAVGGLWRYTVRGPLPSDEVITVEATARDLAGNETTARRCITPPLSAEDDSVL